MQVASTYRILTSDEDWPKTPPWSGSTLCVCLLGRATLKWKDEEPIRLNTQQAGCFGSPPHSLQLDESLILLWPGTALNYSEREKKAMSRKTVEIVQGLLEQETLSPERVQATLHYLSFELGDDAQHETPGSPAQNLHDYLLKNLDQNLSLEALAESFDMSRSRFFRYCRKHLKSSPAKYMSDLRIARAKELLQNPIHTIAQVGYQVGYDSPSTFSHFFKNATGQSPKEYRTNYEWLV